MGWKHIASSFLERIVGTEQSEDVKTRVVLVTSLRVFAVEGIYQTLFCRERKKIRS
jgi:hypothetical protein